MENALDNLSLEERANLVLKRIRNVIYYRLEVEPKDPTRRRCQYIHVLREIRKELEYLTKFPDFEDLKSYLNCIPEKLKSEDSWDAIIGLNDYINNDKPKQAEEVYQKNASISREERV